MSQFSIVISPYESCPNDPLTIQVLSQKPLRRGNGNKEVLDMSTQLPVLVERNLYKDIISRPNCGLCGSEYEPMIKKRFIVFIHKHKHGGLFAKDNLMYCCGMCKGGLSEGYIALDPFGRVWLSKYLYLFRVCPIQYRNISPTNIQYRWEAVKKQYKCSSDDELFKTFESRGYVCFPIVSQK